METSSSASASPQVPEIARLRGSRSDLAKIHIGTHSFWATLLIAQPPYRTLVGHCVVVVLLEDRLELRLSTTAFTTTVHYADVRQLTYCAVRHILFLRTEAAGVETPLGQSSWAAAETALSTVTGPGPLPRRVAPIGPCAARDYVLELSDHALDGCRAVFACLSRRLSAAAQAASGEEENGMDRLLSALVASRTAPSLLADATLLADTGLQEVTATTAQNMVQRWAAQCEPAPLATSMAARTADSTDAPTPPVEALAAAPVVGRSPVTQPYPHCDIQSGALVAMPARGGEMTKVAPGYGPQDLFRIYHAPCPPSWWPRQEPLCVPAPSDMAASPPSWTSLRGATGASDALVGRAWSPVMPEAAPIPLNIAYGPVVRL